MNLLSDLFGQKIFTNTSSRLLRQSNPSKTFSMDFVNLEKTFHLFRFKALNRIFNFRTAPAVMKGCNVNL